MEKTLLIIPILALASSALAQEVAPPAPVAMETAKPSLLELFDTNKDGALQEAEIKRVIFKLKSLDADKDGDLSAVELAAPVPATVKRTPATAEERKVAFTRMDKDGDGKISKEEVSGGLKKNFERIDTNADGFFDQAEQEAVIKRLKK